MVEPVADNVSSPCSSGFGTSFAERKVEVHVMVDEGAHANCMSEGALKNVREDILNQ